MKKFIWLFVALALPRVYMLDWTLTPSELRDEYITNPKDFVMPLGDGRIVLISELQEQENGEEENQEPIENS